MVTIEKQLLIDRLGFQIETDSGEDYKVYKDWRVNRLSRFWVEVFGDNEGNVQVYLNGQLTPIKDMSKLQFLIELLGGKRDGES